MTLFILLLALTAPRLARAADAGRGKAVYEQNCAACHGREGTPYAQDSSDPFKLKREGSGLPVIDTAAAPGAAWLRPRPRDFTRGAFKVRSTAAGALPTDRDLLHAVSLGLPGSAMRSFARTLAPGDIAAVAAYVKSFSPRFGSEAPGKILDVSRPVASSPASIEKGRALYKENGCNSCHGEDGRGDGSSGPALRDDWGNPSLPADFHEPWNLRGGRRAEDLFRSLMTGFNGTPMGGYWDVLDSTEQGWHLANYLASLGEGRPRRASALRAAKVESLPRGPGDLGWEALGPTDFMLAAPGGEDPLKPLPSVDRVAARACYDGESAALLLEWDDRSREAADSAELDWRLSSGPERWLWTAAPEASTATAVVFSSAAYSAGRWRLYFRRPLNPPPSSGAPAWGLLRGAAFELRVQDGFYQDDRLRLAASKQINLLLDPSPPR